MKALEIALQETANNGPPSDEEFTVYDYMTSKEALGDPVGHRKAENDLKKLVAAGTLYMRKGRVNMKQGNIYGRAE